MQYIDSLYGKPVRLSILDTDCGISYVMNWDTMESKAYIKEGNCYVSTV